MRRLMRRLMPTISLKNEVKRELEGLMTKEMLGEVSHNPQILITAIKKKYGYTHSDYIKKLINFYKSNSPL